MLRILLFCSVFIALPSNSFSNTELSHHHLDYVVAYRFCNKFSNIMYSVDGVLFKFTFNLKDDNQQTTALKLITQFPADKRIIINNTKHLKQIAEITCEP